MKRIKVSVKPVTLDNRAGTMGLEVTGPNDHVYGIHTGSIGPYGTSTGVFAYDDSNHKLRVPTAGEYYVDIY